MRVNLSLKVGQQPEVTLQRDGEPDVVLPGVLDVRVIDGGAKEVPQVQVVLAADEVRATADEAGIVALGAEATEDELRRAAVEFLADLDAMEVHKAAMAIMRRPGARRRGEGAIAEAVLEALREVAADA